MIKPTYILLASTLAAGTAFAAYQKDSSSDRHDRQWNNRPHESRSADLAVGAGGAHRVSIDIPFGSVHVMTGRGSEMKVHAVRTIGKPMSEAAHRWLTESKLTARRDGDVLTLREESPISGLRDFKDKGLNDIDFDVDVTLPAGLDLAIDLQAGTVDGGGDYGAVHSVVQAGTVRLRSLGVSGPLDLKTTAGTIEVGLRSALTHDSKLSVTAGEVKVDLPKGSNLDVTANVGVGEIEGLPGARTKSKEGEIHLGDHRNSRIGSGGTRLDVHVGTGSLRIASGGTVLSSSSGSSSGSGDKDDDRDLAADIEAPEIETPDVEVPDVTVPDVKVPVLDAEDAFEVPSIEEISTPYDVEANQDPKLDPKFDREMQRDIEQAVREAQNESKEAMAEAQRSIKEAMKEVDRAIAEAMREMKANGVFKNSGKSSGKGATKGKSFNFKFDGAHFDKATKAEIEAEVKRAMAEAHKATEEAMKEVHKALEEARREMKSAKSGD